MKFHEIKKFIFGELAKPTAPIPSGSESETEMEDLRPIPSTDKPIELKKIDRNIDSKHVTYEKMKKKIENKLISGWQATKSKKFYIRWSCGNFKIQSRPVRANLVEKFKNLHVEAKTKSKLVRQKKLSQESFQHWSKMKITLINSLAIKNVMNK